MEKGIIWAKLENLLGEFVEENILGGEAGEVIPGVEVGKNSPACEALPNVEGDERVLVYTSES